MFDSEDVWGTHIAMVDLILCALLGELLRLAMQYAIPFFLRWSAKLVDFYLSSILNNAES